MFTWLWIMLALHIKNLSWFTWIWRKCMTIKWSFVSWLIDAMGLGPHILSYKKVKSHVMLNGVIQEIISRYPFVKDAYLVHCCLLLLLIPCY